MSAIDDLTQQLLAEIATDFKAKELGSDALDEEYIGPSFADLETKYCDNVGYSKVDFDLAFKQLETKGLIKTGPMVPYENPPGSSVVVIAIFSKREYCYLTEKGYRAAQKTPPIHRTPQPLVHISGGTFHQSPIGIGNTVNQSMTFDISNDSEVIQYLSKLLAQHDPISGGAHKGEVIEMVQMAKTGDLGLVKPIYQRLFGAAKESVKQLAWGVIIAYVSKQLGM